MGEGEAFYQGERLPSKVAMERAGIPVPGLEARDGLATINGSNVLTAMSALLCYDVDRWLRQAEIAAAMSLEALLANLKPYDSSCTSCAASPARCAAPRRSAPASPAATSPPARSRPRCRTPTRCARRRRSSAPRTTPSSGRKSQVEIELNGVGDNPIFVPEDKLTLTGANFQGTPVSLPMEMVGQAITMVCVLSERRLNRLENPAMSQGLPDFLTPNPGFYSGLMLSQYTADMLIVEQRILAAPASTMSIPAAADQEDFVSMGMNTALKNRQILENAYGVLGIEFMAAAQALDFRDFTPGKGVQRRARGHPQARRPPRRRPAALPRPQRDGGAGRLRRDPRGRRGGGRPAGLSRSAAFICPRQPDAIEWPPDDGGHMNERAVRAQLAEADITVGPVHRNLSAPELIAARSRAARASSLPTASSS